MPTLTSCYRVLMTLLLVCLANGALAAEPTLFAPIKGNDIVALRLLAEQNPTLLTERSDQGVSPLLFAAYNERPEMVDFLRERIREPSFFEACVVGDLPAIRRFLALGTNIDQRSPDGFTPIGLAVFFRQPAVAKLLIDAGADVNAKASNTLQVAPIHAAVARSDLATLQLLLEAGANPDLTQQRLMRPIHEASAAGNLPVVAMLLFYGADVQARNEEGKLPSEFANQAGHQALGKRLAIMALDRPN